jgi:hypothetical protein
MHALDEKKSCGAWAVAYAVLGTIPAVITTIITGCYPVSLGCFLSCNVRSKIQRVQGKKPTPVLNCLTHACFPVCAMSQVRAIVAVQLTRFTGVHSAAYLVDKEFAVFRNLYMCMCCMSLVQPTLCAAVLCSGQ